jgi:hypothetical protein
MPFSCQLFVAGDGSAAAELPTPAVASGAHKITTKLGQMKDLGIPFVHLATDRAATTLQPDPGGGVMRVIPRFANVLGRVPPVDDAGIGS